ncbi:MAG: nucleotidyltransferase family protein [Schleiferiaceae bacterium]|jgi:dTDP-glucose pyrophosphorylase|nr:nucleotidyltransferase family protein [Schleiferiaceae bacterium]
MDIDHLLINLNQSITDALKQMDTNRVKLLIVMEDGKYASMLSIGDIQRAIMNKISYDSPVSSILRDKAKVTVCSTSDSEDSIREKMIRFRTEYMPIVDENGTIAKVIFWKELFENTVRNLSTKKLNIPTVIMAGGQGSRLKPLTNVIPKALVPVGDKPIMSVIMDRFAEAGTNQYHISVNYKAKMLHDFYGDRYNNIDINFFKEDKPLGTAGSLHLLKDKINSTFFVSNCDIIIDQDYNELLDYHRRNKNELTIVAALKHMHLPYGIIETNEEGLLENIKEKPDFTYLVNSGMYILEPHLIESIPEDKMYHITELIEEIKQRNGRLGVFPVSEKSWFDIGVWNEYQKTQEQFHHFN